MQVENLSEKIESSIDKALKVKEFIKKELSNQDQIEARTPYENCPLCESTNIIESTVGDCSKHKLYHPKIPPVMQWMDCQNCHHQFISGYLTNEAADLVFTNTPDYLGVGVDIEQNRARSAKIIEKILPYKSNGVWLDVGFGNGSLLFTADEYGFEPIGVDLRKENVKKLQGFGIQAHCDLVQNIEFEKSISVVSMMDVVEHIPYPKEVLVSLHSKMETDGCLLISMPNSENLIWKTLTLQNINPYFNTVEHCHNFSRSRLFSLLKECGFKAIRYGISERYRCCMEVVALRN